MRSLLSVIRSRLGFKRVYHRLINACILIAILAAVSWRIAPNSEWLAGVIATVSAVVALGSYFLSLRSPDDLGAAGTDSHMVQAPTQQDTQIKSGAPRETTFEWYPVELQEIVKRPQVVKVSEGEPLDFLSAMAILVKATPSEIQQTEPTKVSLPVELIVGDLKITVAAGEAKVSIASPEKVGSSPASTMEHHTHESPIIVRRVIH
jgi:hypothetical protein